MVEGGVIKAEDVHFKECFGTVFKTPYVLRLAFSAGIGGLLFGYDTGVISGALLYIKQDFGEVARKTWLQETIVAMAVAGAIVGAGIGGILNDRLGRKPTMIIADILFLSGAIIMALSPAPWMIIIGRIVIGLGVGMASMTAPLFISETSPARIRGALGATNSLLITGGQFLSYLINLGFTNVKGTWRWMLGVAAVPAGVQALLMLTLPESPRWLYRNNKILEAEAILGKIYPPEEVKEEMEALRMSIENEKAQKAELGDVSLLVKVKKAWGTTAVRRGLYAGIATLVAQQFVGINTVMYYSPTIVQMAGYASNSVALKLSLVTSGLNAMGSTFSMFVVDRFGRRRLMLTSMAALISCLLVLSGLFFEAAKIAPKVDHLESSHFGANSTCPAYASAPNPTSWSCMTCLRASKECAFCTNANSQHLPGACVAASNAMQDQCGGEHRTYFTQGCPSKFGILPVLFLGAYIITYSPGMGTVPWILNSELYPLRYRGVCGGIGAVTLWSANLIVSETFLTLTDALGVAGTFLLYACFAVVGSIFIFFLVPETRGLPMEEIEQMLERGFRPSLCCGSKNDDEEKEGGKSDHHG